SPIDISLNSAAIGGAVSFDGNSKITSRGICYSLNLNPTITDNKKLTDGELGVFAVNLSGLAPNTNYYARAFATNAAGPGYGNNVPFTTYAVFDRDGNFYHGVLIVTQLWMKENLKTTKYNDATAIPIITDNTTWSNLTTPGYCWYNNDVGFKDTYGALYNWYAVSTGKLCPAGWHVPTDVEWTTLTTYLGGQSVAGGKLKEAGTAHWTSPNTGATNEAGFTALAGGDRSFNGTFGFLGNYGIWWSATEYIAIGAWGRCLENSSGSMLNPNYDKKYGFSIRCLKDN
ncbi:MAG: fibrobacter succinogenes major paralogous domain-containing protein, partial [Bacteroidia bacterium]|nr:fibrobacter succinogenes major paralogous domain-containing protein [Bacteroidia bacterium]